MPSTQSDDEPMTKTSGFLEDELDLERGDFEIGLCGDKGYLKIPLLPNGDPVRFTVPKEEVEAYVEKRDEQNPPPQLPDGIDRDPVVDAPEHWESGEATHTGGGIYCRIWRREYKDHLIEVIYNVPDPTGISIGLNTLNYGWIGEITQFIFDDSPLPDKQAQQKAIPLMKQVNNGDHDDTIEELLS
jgi:hypothetical protein